MTSDFELLAERVLKSYLPDNAKIFGFGSNTLFQGNAQNKIRNLANKINLECNDRLINQIPSTSSKEEGLDVVGWIPFEDNNPNTIIILGQSACGKDWVGKQNETQRYDRFYNPYILPFFHAMLFPYNLNNNFRLFGFDKDITHNQLIFERRRIVFLSSEGVLSELTNSKRVVDKIIEYSEDIV